MYKDERDTLTSQEAFIAREIALDEIRGAKHPHDTHFIARCWFKALVLSLKKSGYSVCLKKENLEIIL